MKQLAQAATQEMIKGATYLGKQGVQAWNSYWNKPAMNQPPSGAVLYQNTAHITHQFPPTHGTPMQAPTVTKDPNLISILDLESLKTHGSSTTTALHPLATFKVPHGCSFISFSPSGLALFTASNKGDVQSVWDLMRIQYAKPSFLKTGSQGTGIQGPHVRQIAQFSRMTIARIIDVVWTSPHGERAAMVTEPGTVHILDLPASAFTWPPPRRKVSALKQDEEGAGLSAASVASSAVNTLWTAARPLVGHRRRSSTGISAITAASVKSQAGHGTQALAAGISRSVGAATGRMNEMRKSSSNKLHLPRSSIVPRTACIGLITKKRNDLVMVVGGGIVRLYSVKSRRADCPADKQKASRNAKYVEFRLAPLPDLKIAPEPVRDVQEGDLELTEKEDSRWNFKKPQAKPKVSRVADSSIPQAEIESNAPYQPFHTDRRVRIYTYSHEQTPLPSPSVSALLSPLQPSVVSVSAGFSRTNFPSAFGGSIRTEILNVIRPQNVEDSIQSLSDHRALPPSAIERVMSFPGDSEDSEQIVITTRIRKSVRSSGEAIDANEEGFFEDDCEVLDFASQRV
jgi:WD40 repeat protein